MSNYKKMDDEVETSSTNLNFSDTKHLVSKSRTYKTKITPRNGSNFQMGSDIIINLPSALTNTFTNTNHNFIKLRISNNSSEKLTLDRAGVYSIFSRLSLKSISSEPVDIQNYNAVVTALLDTHASPSYRCGSGAILMGLTNALRGAYIPANSSRIFCFPILLSGVGDSLPHKMVPLFSHQPLGYTFTLASSVEAFKTASAVDNSEILIDSVEYCMSNVQLSDKAMDILHRKNNGVYEFLANGFSTTSATMYASASSQRINISNIGFGCGSMERLFVLHRPTSTISSHSAYSLGHRIKNHLSSAQLSIAGQNFPDRPIEVGDGGAEIYSQMLIADHSLIDFSKDNTLNNLAVEGAGFKNGLDVRVANEDYVGSFNLNTGAGTESGDGATASSVGTFLFAIDTDSGLVDLKSSHLYGGVDVRNQPMTFTASYDAGSVGCEILFIAQYTQKYKLDMTTTGIWTSSQ